MSGINHPLVLESAHTCSACPDQYEGTLTDGTEFYLRYRSGRAELGVGADQDAAVMDTIDGARISEQIGDYLDGMFDSDEQARRCIRPPACPSTGSHGGRARRAPGKATMTDPELTVHKLAAYLPVSCCQMTDSTGVNHCEHPPPPRPPWRRRLRWAVSARWGALRMRLGSWLAGVDLDDRDD